MKLILRTFCLLCFLFLSLAHSKEGGWTHGGDAIQCSSPTSPLKKVTLFDFYEGYQIYQKPIKDFKCTLSLKECAMERIQNTKIISQPFYLRLLSILNQISFDFGSIPEIKDEHSTIRLRPGCKRIQLAGQFHDLKEGQTNIRINRTLFNSLSNEDQVGLFVHEAITRLFIEDLNIKNSKGVRLLTYFIFSNFIDLQNQSEIISFLKTLGYPKSSFDCFEKLDAQYNPFLEKNILNMLGIGFFPYSNEILNNDTCSEMDINSHNSIKKLPLLLFTNRSDFYIDENKFPLGGFFPAKSQLIWSPIDSENPYGIIGYSELIEHSKLNGLMGSLNVLQGTLHQIIFLPNLSETLRPDSFPTFFNGCLNDQYCLVEFNLKNGSHFYSDQIKTTLSKDIHLQKVVDHLHFSIHIIHNPVEMNSLYFNLFDDLSKNFNFKIYGSGELEVSALSDFQKNVKFTCHFSGENCLIQTKSKTFEVESEKSIEF